MTQVPPTPPDPPTVEVNPKVPDSLAEVLYDVFGSNTFVVLHHGVPICIDGYSHDAFGGGRYVVSVEADRLINGDPNPAYHE